MRFSEGLPIIPLLPVPPRFASIRVHSRLHLCCFALYLQSFPPRIFPSRPASCPFVFIRVVSLFFH